MANPLSRVIRMQLHMQSNDLHPIREFRQSRHRPHPPHPHAHSGAPTTVAIRPRTRPRTGSAPRAHSYSSVPTTITGSPHPRLGGRQPAHPTHGLATRAPDSVPAPTHPTQSPARVPRIAQALAVSVIDPSARVGTAARSASRNRSRAGGESAAT